VFQQYQGCRFIFDIEILGTDSEKQFILNRTENSIAVAKEVA